MALEQVDEFLLGDHPELSWELLHENSKVSRHERHPMFALPPSDAAIVGVMRRLRTVKPYADSPKVALPAPPPAEVGFDEAVRSRVTARGFGTGAVSLHQLAKVLSTGYGVTRDNVGTHYPRPFRAVPSGGALYPLELYVHATRVDDLDPGLYHYDPEDHSLDVLPARNQVSSIASYMVQPELTLGASAVIFVSAVFFRSIFKYGDRGYRFVLIEAGHLAQNAILAAHSLNLATAPIGGYFDRELDRHLGFDGLNESTVYVLLLGQREDADWAELEQ